MGFSTCYLYVQFLTTVEFPSGNKKIDHVQRLSFVSKFKYSHRMYRSGFDIVPIEAF